MTQRLAVLFSSSLVALILLALFSMAPLEASGALSGVKVCIDPGHGGTDPGAVNEAFGLYESEINLDVSFALKGLLESDGAEVVMTRSDDSYHDNGDRYTLCNEEQATIIVSVHTNSVTDPTWDGAMCLYFHDDDRLLAQAIHGVVLPSLAATAPAGVVFDDFGLSKYASGVLLKSDMPAAMVEPLFMSNPYEAALLQQSIAGGCADLSCRRGEIARAIHQGVRNYFGANPPTPTPEPSGSVHVDAIDMWFEQKGPNVFVYTRITLVDRGGSPVAGALVSLETAQPDGSLIQSADTTADDGAVTFRLRSNQSGTYTSAVSDVVKDGWTYDAAANVESSQSLSVP